MNKAFSFVSAIACDAINWLSENTPAIKIDLVFIFISLWFCPYVQRHTVRMVSWWLKSSGPACVVELQ
jgi:hypothetical protein